MVRSFGTEISGNRRWRGELSSAQRSYAMGQLEAGLSARKVALQLQCAASTITRLVKRYKDTNSVDAIPRSGAPKRLSDRDERAVVRLARRYPKWTYARLIGQTGMHAHKATICRLLKRHNLTNWRAKRRPKLSPEVAKERLAFARRYHRWKLRQWRRVIFSDECSVERGTGKDNVWVFRTPQQEWDPQMIEEYQGKDISQMFWAAFWYGGRSDLFPMERDETSQRNGFSAKSLLLIFYKAFQTFWEPGMTFQQDNAPVQKARIVQNWLHDNDISVIEWPRYSPDLNPIEHLWWALKRKILKLHPELEHQGKSEEAINNLIEAAKESWDRIGARLLRKLVRSMPERLEAVIKAKGWQTKY